MDKEFELGFREELVKHANLGIPIPGMGVPNPISSALGDGVKKVVGTVGSALWNASPGPSMWEGAKNLALPLLGGIAGLSFLNTTKNRIQNSPSTMYNYGNNPRGFKFSQEKKAMHPLLFTLQTRALNDAITNAKASPEPPRETEYTSKDKHTSDLLKNEHVKDYLKKLTAA